MVEYLPFDMAHKLFTGQLVNLLVVTPSIWNDTAIRCAGAQLEFGWLKQDITI